MEDVPITLTVALSSLAAAILLAADNPDSKRWNFEDAKLGELPKGWTAAKTGAGAGSVWKVLEDDSAPKGSKVLAQTSPDGPNPMFNLCVAADTSYSDVDLSVAMKPREGKNDQGGGLVWRYKDASNYYVCRMNPLEDNFRVYKVVEGKRSMFKSADVNAPAGKWHTIRVVNKGSQIQCYLNGKLLLEVTDDTFKEAGKIGLWTKSDAVTSFDDLTVTVPK